MLGLQVWNRVFRFKLTWHINKTIYMLTTITTIIELSERGAGRWNKRSGGWNKNRTSSEHFLLRAGLTTGGGSGQHEWWAQFWAGLVLQTRRKTSVSKACGSIGGGLLSQEVCGSKRRHAGIEEGISACIYVANSHCHKVEKGRRSDCRHSASVAASPAKSKIRLEQVGRGVRMVTFWLMIACITWNNNLVTLLEGLCNSNPCRFEFSGFQGFAGIEPTTSVPHSDQLS